MIRRHWALEPRDKGSILAFPCPSCANSQTRFLYAPTLHLPFPYYENTYHTDLLGELGKIIKKWDVIYTWNQPRTEQILNKYGSPISWLLEWLKKMKKTWSLLHREKQTYVLWDVTESGWEWACSWGIRRWTQMGLSTLSIQLPLAKCQTQWQAIMTDRNRTWCLPWGTLGKQMEEQISSSGLSYNNTRDERANSKFLKCNDSRSRSWCVERQAPPEGALSLTLLLSWLKFTLCLQPAKHRNS